MAFWWVRDGIMKETFLLRLLTLKRLIVSGGSYYIVVFFSASIFTKRVQKGIYTAIGHGEI